MITTRAVSSAGVILAAVVVSSIAVRTQAPAAPTLAPPVFHHLHLNSVDPAASIKGYETLFPGATEKTTVAGFEALKNGKSYLLFTKVNAAAPREPQSAYWHQVWFTGNVREYLARARANKMEPEPLYTSDNGEHVEVSSDALPGMNTKAALAEARAKGTAPTHQAGFTFTHGPEGMSVEGMERAGETGRLVQIDMWQDDPVCAELWYVTHLGSTRRAARGETAPPTEANCKVAPAEPSWPSTMKQGTRRAPSGRAGYGDVTLFWYTRPGDRPLVSTRGQAMDHFGFTVRDFDAWTAKLKNEKVTIVRDGYKFGDSRAIMIEGPSHEAIELIEEK